MAGGNPRVPMSHPARLKNRNKDSTNLISGFGHWSGRSDNLASPKRDIKKHCQLPRPLSID